MACIHKLSGNLKEGANIFKTTSKTLEKDVSFINTVAIAITIMTSIHSITIFPSAPSTHFLWLTRSVLLDIVHPIFQIQREEERTSYTGAYSATLL